MNIKVTDSLERIREVNKELYYKYNRHVVLEDKEFLFDPTIDPMSYFSNVTDIRGNNDDTYKVSLGFNTFILRRIPHYRWVSEEEYLEEQMEKLTQEIETTYDFEDNGITNICKIHHIFIKRFYSSYHRKIQYFVWSLKEYFDGNEILMFDYGAQYPFQYHDTPAGGRHEYGKLISLKAAIRFSQELLSHYIEILKLGYIPHRYNDNGIFMNYKNDKIEWKFIDYLYCKKENPTSEDIRTSIESFSRILCWNISTYTNYSTHPLSKNQHHPFWTGLENLMKEKSKYFKEIGDKEYQLYQKEEKRWNMNWPVLTKEIHIETITSFLSFSQSK